MTKKTVAGAVAAVITNANMAQADRAVAWLGVVNEMQFEGEKFAQKVRNWVKKTGMTIFTLADAKAFVPLYAKQWLADPTEVKPSKTPMEQRAIKAAKNKLSWLRRELRAADVKVESDARGGANNKTGKNASTNKPKDANVGLSKWNEAMALIRQSIPELTTELDRIAADRILAKLEIQHKAQVTK